MSEDITLKLILKDQFGKGNITQSTYNARITRVLNHIVSCGTEIYGFSKYECPDCGHTEIHYGTCRDPHCPACGGRARMAWIQNQRTRAVRSAAFHIVFTVPDRHLNRLAMHDRRYFYNALFDASSRALRQLCRSEKYFGARTIGFFSCLHTWGSNLSFHPHIHTVLYGAGLDQDGNLVSVRGGKDYLFPARKLAALFKKKMMRLLRKKYEYSNSVWLDDLRRAGSSSWNVQINRGLEKPDSAINYLGRYVFRTAISNRRIKDYDGESVTFEYKDYRDHDGQEDRKRAKKKLMKLKAEEFIRRFTDHILPARFKRVRFYGYLSANQKDVLKKVKKLTDTDQILLADLDEAEEDRDPLLTADPKECCSHCGASMKFKEGHGRLLGMGLYGLSDKDLLPVLIRRILNVPIKD